MITLDDVREIMPGFKRPGEQHYRSAVLLESYIKINPQLGADALMLAEFDEAYEQIHRALVRIEAVDQLEQVALSSSANAAYALSHIEWLAQREHLAERCTKALVKIGQAKPEFREQIAWTLKTWVKTAVKL